ncbi:MAG TPA: nuclear transport factor 2 family protein [Acidimicrobiales bacterium]|nr:nuclear transport factor 2 family protein [Acidimicrobiales bacterium]
MSAEEVRRAAEHLVRAFSQHDTVAYFDAFAPEATFIFHNTPNVLMSRDAYATLWASWESEGFRVLSCTSQGGVVQMLGEDVGVFFHTVRTTLAPENAPLSTGERETIVFQRREGAWKAVHEHLSLDPSF